MEQTKTKRRNWEELIIEADTMVTHELLLACEEGDLEEVKKGLQAYHKACLGGARHELWLHLNYLMQDVILAKFSNNYRTQKHWEKICKWRGKIEEQIDYDDFLTENNIKEEWKSAFESGKELATIFVSEAKELKELTWTDVFEKSYHPDNYGKKR